MYHQKRRRNFTTTYSKSFREEDLVEQMCTDMYHYANSLYREMCMYIETAQNDTLVVQVLREAICRQIDVVRDMSCWLSEERCEQWCNTVNRYEETVKAAADAYTKNTIKK